MLSEPGEQRRLKCVPCPNRVYNGHVLRGHTYMSRGRPCACSTRTVCYDNKAHPCCQRSLSKNLRGDAWSKHLTVFVAQFEEVSTLQHPF